MHTFLHSLVIDQIEFANFIILNKTDLVDEHTVGVLKAAIRKLNPGANIIKSSFGKVIPDEIVHTGLFDFEEA